MIEPSINGYFSKLEGFCYVIKTCSIIYLSKYEKYNLFTYNICNDYPGSLKIRWYDLTNYFNTTSKNSSLSDKISDTIQTTIDSTISNEKSQKIDILFSTEINDISTTSLIETSYSTQIEDSTENYFNENTEQSAEINDSTEQAEQSTEINSSEIAEQSTEINDSTEQTEKTTERADTTEEVEYCIDNKKIKDNMGKCICDNTNGYYFINNSIYLDDNCYNEQTKPVNFYLNQENKIYEMCQKNCQTCNNSGNEIENNCTSCINNYIKIKDIYNITNCFPKCDYYYYFTKYNIYTCTFSFKCPEEAKLLIREKNKCINNCQNDDIYNYQYSGECFTKCPNDTILNEYKCEVRNTNLCSLSIFQLNLTFNDLINNNIDFFAKNYVDEFNYTRNQIINYTNKEYSLVIYKNKYCIKELLLTVPMIDFGECYEKIKLIYNISEELVIAILDKYYEK